MSLDLAEITRRADAAHPGPWSAGPEEAELKGDVDDPWIVSGWSFWLTIASNDTKADAEFIAHAREDVPALVAEVERLRSLVADALAIIDEEFGAHDQDHPVGAFQAAARSIV